MSLPPPQFDDGDIALVINLTRPTRTRKDLLTNGTLVEVIDSRWNPLNDEHPLVRAISGPRVGEEFRPWQHDMIYLHPLEALALMSCENFLK